MARVVSLEIEYVGGVSFAAGNTEDETEWPPHPDRFFLAMVSAWSCDEDPAEASALRWIESLGSPTVHVPSDVGKRNAYKSYVPATGNAELLEGKSSSKKDARSGKGYMGDKAILDIKSQVFRQHRYFPAAIMPDDSRSVWFSWKLDESMPQPIDDLRSLSYKVSSLGHPSSLVRVAVHEKEPPENLRTYVTVANQETVDVFLRCPHPGRFDEVCSGFKEACKQVGTDETARSAVMWHPKKAKEDKYRIKTDVVEPSGWYGSDWIVLEFSRGSFVPELVAFPILANALKNAILSHCQDPIPESISGHKPNKKPSENPHMAIVPLANSGWEHSNGDIKGIGIIMPTKDRIGAGDRSALERTVDVFLENRHKLTFGRAGETCLRRPQNSTMKSLDVGRYVGVGKEWVTVTPIVPDGHYKDRPKHRYPDMIARSCVRMGLPEPELIHVSKQPYVTGSYPAYFDNVDKANHTRKTDSTHLQLRGWRYPRRGRFDGLGLVHARIMFGVPVRGPIVLGRGRHYGLGLCMRVNVNG